MKKFKLFLAAFAVMCGMSANAQSWTGSYAGEGQYYLFNVGKAQFFTKGNGWGTQASTTADLNGALIEQLIPEGSYYVLRPLEGVFENSTWGLEHLSGGTVYTDQSRGKLSTWEFVQNGTYENGCPLYNIISRENHGGGEGAYLLASADNTIVGPGTEADKDSDYAKWILLPTDLTADQAEILVAEFAIAGYKAKYNALREEMLAIGDALADAATDEAGFNGAMTALREAAINYLFTTNVAEPVDVTNVWIVNPAPYANADGWTVTDGEHTSQWASNPINFDAANQCAETWSNCGAKLKQTIYNLPAGEYELTAIAFTRENFGDDHITMNAYLNAGNTYLALVTIDPDAVNNRTQANEWFNNGNGVNKLPFTLEAPAESLEIGLEADVQHDAWMVWRSFSLTYKSLPVTDGISTVETKAVNGDALYDLQGRRVAQPTKGIYIVNGKKVIK